MARPSDEMARQSISIDGQLHLNLRFLKQVFKEYSLLTRCINKIDAIHEDLHSDVPAEKILIQKLVKITNECIERLSVKGWHAPDENKKIAIVLEALVRAQQEVPYLQQVELPSYVEWFPIFQNDKDFTNESQQLDSAFMAYTLARADDSALKLLRLVEVDRKVQEWIAAKPAAQSFMHHPDLAIKSARGPAVLLFRELVQAELLKPENVAALASQAQLEVAASIMAIKEKLGGAFNVLLVQLFPEINGKLSDEMAVKLNSALKALLPHLKDADPKEAFIKFANLLMRECPELAAGDVLTLANWKTLQPSGLKPGKETAEIEKAFAAYEREQTPTKRDDLQKSLSAWLEAKHEKKNSKRRDVVELFSQLAQHVAKPALAKEEKSEAGQDYAPHRMGRTASE